MQRLHSEAFLDVVWITWASFQIAFHRYVGSAFRRGTQQTRSSVIITIVWNVLMLLHGTVVSHKFAQGKALGRSRPRQDILLLPTCS